MKTVIQLNAFVKKNTNGVDSSLQEPEQENEIFQCYLDLEIKSKQKDNIIKVLNT